MMFMCVTATIFTSFVCDSSQVPQSVDAYAVLTVRATTSNTTTVTSVCVLYNKQQSLPSHVTEADFRCLVSLYPKHGCATDDYYAEPQVPVEKCLVAVAGGNCSFLQKAASVQQMKGAAVLVVDYQHVSTLTVPDGSSTSFSSVKIPVAVLAYTDYVSILNGSQTMEAALFAPADPLWDWNMIVMVLLPTSIVVSASLWAMYDETQFDKRHRCRNDHSNNRDQNNREQNNRDQNNRDQNNREQNNRDQNNREHYVEISMVHIICWFIFVCSIIMLLYIFYDYLVYFFIVLFSVSSAYSLYHCLHPVCSYLPTDKLSFIHRKVKLEKMLLLLLCVMVGLLWAYNRHAWFSWMIQDVLGASLCIFFIHTLQLPNLKFIMLLLLFLLIYDVFFVFITPFFTRDGTSIMESVATGQAGSVRETLPLLFLFPALSDSPIRTCLGRVFSFLGYGDVAIPGMLLAHNARFDVKSGNRMMVYFVSSSLAYLLGMVACVLSVSFTSSAQPALLYLVPSTLGVTIAMVVLRGELRHIFSGQPQHRMTSDEH